MTTMTYTGTLVVTSCWCGIALAIPRDLYDIAQRKGTEVHCPIGHTFVYGDLENDRLKREAEAALRRARNANAALVAAQDQAHAAERSAAAYRGHLTRLRNKITKGVCPAPGCRRHFDNLQAHVESQHPAWASEHADLLSGSTDV